MPELIAIDCLKDDSETPQEQAYREQLRLQGHLLCCLSSAYHKGGLHQDFDDVGLLLLGLQYHKHVSICDLDCTHNSYNACKILPYMCFKLWDLFTPDFDCSIFFGPGLAGIMQAIEHLNKMLRSCMHTWTSGKKKFLVQFLKTCYEVLVGKYAVLNQAVKPSNFFEKMKNNAKGIQNGF